MEEQELNTIEDLRGDVEGDFLERAQNAKTPEEVRAWVDAANKVAEQDLKAADSNWNKLRQEELDSKNQANQKKTFVLEVVKAVGLVVGTVAAAIVPSMIAGNKTDKMLEYEYEQNGIVTSQTGRGLSNKMINFFKKEK